MKTNIKLVGLLAFTFLAGSVSQAQWFTWYNIANVPVDKAGARVHMTQMRKALPYLEAGEPIPTNKVPLVAQVDYREEPDITPESLISSTGFDLWQGVEIPKGTKDPVLKPYKKQNGNSVGAILKMEGDGTYPLRMKDLIIRAEIFTPDNEYLLINPSAIRVEGFVYQRDKYGEVLVNEDGDILKTNKVTYTSLKRLAKSRSLVDSANIYIQFGEGVSVNASNMPGDTNTQKIKEASRKLLEEIGEISIWVAFIEGAGTEEEFVLSDAGTFFWIFEPLE